MCALLAVSLLLSACRGAQSALDPAGRDAGSISSLFIWMSAGFALVWLAVMAIALFGPKAKPLDERRAGRLLIIGGGVVFPVIVLTILLVIGLSRLSDVTKLAPEGGMTIEVSGSQWWWRVRYLRPGHEPVEVANEIRLPVNERVNVSVESRDVVHSFWIPSIAGKMDMIPGRVNRIAVEPTRTGRFRGACAEFCGTSHARMNFVVVVSDRAAFDSWLASQSRDARAPVHPLARRGERAFFSSGCNTCHTVRGTVAQGMSGPDLTHVGSRYTIAAGTLPRRPEELRQWVAKTELLKPGAHMPAFARLPDDALTSIAAYLAELQ